MKISAVQANNAGCCHRNPMLCTSLDFHGPGLA
jgi:hypothetical protein